MKNPRGMYEWAGWSDPLFCILGKYESVPVSDVEYVLNLLANQNKINWSDKGKYYHAINEFDSGEGKEKHLKIIKELAEKLHMRVIIRTIKKKTNTQNGSTKK